MNILYIIGNGFDLNLNLKTSYLDFYDYYLKTNSDCSHVENLKNLIKKDLPNWSDLEIALGRYTSEVSNSSEFEQILINIGDSLADYLQAIEDSLIPDSSAKRKMYEYLSFPENSLPQASREDVYNFKTNRIGEIWNIDIVTFNYTEFFEKFIDDNIIGQNIGGSHTNILRSINHIHGYLNDRMILGVNDESQVSNKEFLKDQDFRVSFIKDEYNTLIKHKINDLFNQKIAEADIICLFGSSLGETDNVWWYKIAEQLKRDVKVIIYQKSNLVSSRWQYKIGVVEREMKRVLIDKVIEDKNIAESKILVGVNRDMFKFI